MCHWRHILAMRAHYHKDATCFVDTVLTWQDSWTPTKLKRRQVIDPTALLVAGVGFEPTTFRL